MLRVRELSKTYPVRRRSRDARTEAEAGRISGGRLQALSPITFDARPGEILGVLGANGAGKTTLLRVLATAMLPTTGTATFDGVDIVEHPRDLRRRLGFLSGTTGLYGRLTAREMVAYFGELHGMDSGQAKRRADELLERLELQAAAHRACDKLSTGMKQKVSIARTLVHDPDLVIFDEPTTGLDLRAAQTILELVDSFREQNKTVLLCTHHVNEIETLCDRVLVLRQGRPCFQGTLDQLRTDTSESSVDRALLHLIAPTEVHDAA